MKITGYTGSSGRCCQAAIPSITRSVMVVMVCLDTAAPEISATCAEISPWVNPFADNEITRSSIPESRRCRFATITGSNEDSRSRATSISTGPAPLSTVFGRVPFREFPPVRPAGSCLPYPR
jgi:hypothetical protein